MYYILNGGIYPGAAVATLKHMLKFDNGEFNQTHGIQSSTSEPENELPLKRQRRHTVLNLT